MTFAQPPCLVLSLSHLRVVGQTCACDLNCLCPCQQWPQLQSVFPEPAVTTSVLACAAVWKRDTTLNPLHTCCGHD